MVRKGSAVQIRTTAPDKSFFETIFLYNKKTPDFGRRGGNRTPAKGFGNPYTTIIQHAHQSPAFSNKKLIRDFSLLSFFMHSMFFAPFTILFDF